MLTDRFDPRYYGRPLVFAYRPHWFGGTFSRASAATTIGRDGLVTAVASGIPRIAWLDMDADGVRETPNLRLEPSRTNLLTWSEDFAQAAWTKTNVTVSADQTTAPDGAFTADLLVETAAEGLHQVSRPVSLADNTDYILSAFARPRERTWLVLAASDKAGVTRRAFFDLATGAVGIVDSGIVARIERFANGWWRCVMRFNSGSGAGAPVVAFRLAPANGIGSYTGDGTSGLYIWGAQLEAGPAATSYIRTADTPVTRAADALSFPLPASLSRPVPMTLYLRFVERGASVLGTAFQNDILEIGSVGGNPLLQVDNSAAGSGFYRVVYVAADASQSSSIAPVAVAIGDVVELAAVLTAAGAARIRIARNGGAEQAGPLGTARGLGTTPWSAQTLRLAPRGQSPLDVMECKVALGEYTIAEMRAM